MKVTVILIVIGDLGTVLKTNLIDQRENEDRQDHSHVTNSLDTRDLRRFAVSSISVKKKNIS